MRPLTQSGDQKTPLKERFFRLFRPAPRQEIEELKRLADAKVRLDLLYAQALDHLHEVLEGLNSPTQLDPMPLKHAWEEAERETGDFFQYLREILLAFDPQQDLQSMLPMLEKGTAAGWPRLRRAERAVNHLVQLSFIFQALNQLEAPERAN